MRVKWSFENGCIQVSQLARITKEFKHVLPYINASIKLKGIWNREDSIDQGTLYTAFKSQDTTYYDGDSFFFGVHNINSGQDCVVREEHYTNAVITFLTIAKKVLEHDIHVEVDASDAECRKGIELCQNILGHDYDLMDITQNGRLRFKTWELTTYGK